MKRIVITSIVGALVFAGCAKQVPSKKVESTQSPAVTTQATATPAPETKNAKVFTVTGLDFTFDLKEIKVKKGDTVQIVFKNTEGMHDWRVDEFNAATKKIRTGEQDTVTFVADKVGTFEYYCSVGKHRAMGMKGNLIVQ